MTATTMAQARTGRPTFYVWMAATCALIAFGGFAPTYWLQLPAGTFVGRPILYLHGTRDGCLAADLVKDAQSHLPDGSRTELVADAGHFLHLEQPAEVNRLILDWLTS